MSCSRFRARTGPVLSGKVSAGEDVRGGEGGGGLDAVEEEDFVLGGYENYTGFLLVSYACLYLEVGGGRRTWNSVSVLPALWCQVSLLSRTFCEIGMSRSGYMIEMSVRAVYGSVEKGASLSSNSVLRGTSRLNLGRGVEIVGRLRLVGSLDHGGGWAYPPGSFLGIYCSKCCRGVWNRGVVPGLG